MCEDDIPFFLLSYYLTIYKASRYNMSVFILLTDRNMGIPISVYIYV